MSRTATGVYSVLLNVQLKMVLSIYMMYYSIAWKKNLIRNKLKEIIISSLVDCVSFYETIR